MDNVLYHTARRALCALSLGSLAVAGAGCRKEASASAAPPQRPPTAVNVVEAIERDAPVYLDEIGKVAPREMVTLMPQVAGRIEALHFADGADLKKGQLLFTIDARPFQAALEQAQGQLAKDEAASANADKFLNRQADIFKQGFVSPSDYDTAQFNARGAKAAVQSDQASIAAAKLNIEYCNIRSPIDGRAGARLADPGNIVKINETPLLVIQRLDPIYADFTINEGNLTAVRAHMADHTLHTMVRLPEEGGAGREGELTFLDNSVQDASGTIKLRATLPNKDRHFWPGQFVNVRLVLRVHPSVMVPLVAPQLGQQGSFVYVVNKDSIAELHPVVLGQQQGDWVVIEKGVKKGDRAIVNGQLMVFPGGPVNVVPAPPGPAASAPETQPGAAGAGSAIEAPPGTTDAPPATTPIDVKPTTQPSTRKTSAAAISRRGFSFQSTGFSPNEDGGAS